MKLLGLMPLKLHYAFSGIIRFIAKDLLHYRCNVVRRNLEICFPEKTPAERELIFDQFYRNFADIIVETIWFGASNPKRLRRSHLVEIEDITPLNRVHAAAPGVILLDSHSGNWELLGGISSYNYSGEFACPTEQNFCVIYMALTNKVWDDIFKKNRTAVLEDPDGFQGLVENKQVVRHILTHKGEGKIYDLKTDQHPFAGSARMDIDFMGVKTTTMFGGIALAQRFGMGIVYLNIDHDRRGHYTMRFEEICNDASKLSTEELVKTYYTRLERDIRRNPANYLWTHKRFKTTIKY